MSTISLRSLSFFPRANWEWTDASWQTKALMQIPVIFVGLGTILFIAGVISVAVSRGRRAIFATLTAAVLTFVAIRALTFASYAIEYLADIWDNIGTLRNISSAITVLSSFQDVLDFIIFLLVLRDRKDAFTELPGSPATKSTYFNRLINAVMTVMLVIMPVSSLARGIINRVASESVQINREEFLDIMRKSRILVHVWTGAFGIAVAVVGVKAFGFRRRLASIGLRDATRVGDHSQANVSFSVSFLNSMLPFAYYLVIVCLGFMRKLWTTTSSMQRVSSRTTHSPKFESTSTV